MFERLSHYLGEKLNKGMDPAMPESVSFEIRRMRDGLLQEECWGREYYCRGTPVLFTPYRDWRDWAKDVPIIAPFVVREVARTLWFRAAAWAGLARAFAWGVVEFRSDYTRAFYFDEAVAYDWGRELAHRVTGRRWEQA